MTRCLLMVVAALVACTSLCGQDSSPAASPPAMEKVSTNSAERGIYVSGFEILDPAKNPNDLGFYPIQVLARVRSKWYSRIPGLQKSIGRKRGLTLIEFEIGRDGALGRMTTVESGGDAFLDDAAWQAVSSAAPFAALPKTYRKKTLNLRMHFGYDQPAVAAAPFCNGPNWGSHPAAYVLHQFKEGLTAPKATYQPDPEYSEQARREKYQSVVQVAGTVDPEGVFTDLCLTQAAGEGLDEKAMEAVRTWKFEPASLGGEPVAMRLLVEVSFRLY